MILHDLAILAGGLALGFSAVHIANFGDRIVARFRHPCRKGHDWRHRGGRNAGCHKECVCSVPVNECARCGDCDYGNNVEAAATIVACPIAEQVRSCTCQGGHDQPHGAQLRANDCPVHGEMTFGV